jgi:hypothetical protein
VEDNIRKDGSVYSSKLKAGKRRVYFFDVRKTKGEDLYISITESTRKFNSDGFEKHKIFVYKEDFLRFAKELQESIDFVKQQIPDFDYEQFNRRDEEWAAREENKEETPLNGTSDEMSW